MAINNVSLSSASKNNLLAVQKSNDLLQTAISHLASGKKVNSAFENASAFLQSQGFLDRANDLSNVKDGVSNALQTVAAANNGIDAVSKLVDQAKGITTAALQTQDPTQRAAYAQQFDDLRSQIDGLVADSGLNGHNLIDGTSGSLTVGFNENGSSNLTIANSDLTSNGLGVAASTNAFVNNSDINAAISNLSSATSKLRTTSASLGSNATVISTRQDFTTNLIGDLQQGADNLTNADLNEEAANILATQAQNALSIQALSISSKAQQAIVKLF